MPWRLEETFGTNYVTKEKAQSILVVMYSADCVLSLFFGWDTRFSQHGFSILSSKCVPC